MEEETKTEKPEQEETPVDGSAEQPPQEKKPDEGLKAILEQAKAEFEKRLADTTTALNAKIKERDSMIAELIAGKSTADEQNETFVDKLNKTRENNRKFI